MYVQVMYIKHGELKYVSVSGSGAATGTNDWWGFGFSDSMYWVYAFSVNDSS